MSQSPILIYDSGGTVGGRGAPPILAIPTYSQAGTTKLLAGQSYVDVVFGSIQVDDQWVLVACDVDNTTDIAPLNIWPGIITNRTGAGFRLQLNGLPDTGNYFLHWAVSGVNIVPTPASTYYLSGPATGDIVPATFTVHLPPSTTISGIVTVTPSDGGAGGTFSPTSVSLSTASASATFTYTPAAYGTVIISTTNSSSILTDPAGITFVCVVTTYTLSGPSTGAVGSASSNFTAALPVGAIVTGTITVTPSDGGAGGTFTPTTVGLTTGAPSATFTYNAASAGVKTISVANTGGLINPANLTYTAVALPTYTLTGPSSGVVSVASTNFTVTLAGSPTISGTVTVTPSSGGGGGTFTPTSVGVTDASPVATFTYTPASAGAKTISVTNDRALTNPGNLTYTVSAPIADGDPVSTWPDSSVNANNATQTGSSRPIYKTNILNTKPIVRFTAAGTSGLNLTSQIPGTGTWTMFAVMKPTTTSDNVISMASSLAGGPIGVSEIGLSYYCLQNGTDFTFIGNSFGTAFHVFSGIGTVGAEALYVDGTIQGTSNVGGGGTNFTGIGYRAFDGTYSTGDIAEIIFYNATLSGTNRANIEKYLGTKYGITVAGGSAVQPDTVTGLKGWWKADALV